MEGWYPGRGFEPVRPLILGLSGARDLRTRVFLNKCIFSKLVEFSTLVRFLMVLYGGDSC